MSHEGRGQATRRVWPLPAPWGSQAPTHRTQKQTNKQKNTKKKKKKNTETPVRLAFSRDPGDAGASAWARRSKARSSVPYVL